MAAAKLYRTTANPNNLCALLFRNILLNCETTGKKRMHKPQLTAGPDQELIKSLIKRG
jgi:hypothetical protein